MVQPLTDSDASKIAHDLCPVFYQAFRSQFDLIVPISETDPPSTKVCDPPPIYYRAMQDPGRCNYCLYAVYHLYDTAAPHQHDFEGILVRNDPDSRDFLIGTVCHWGLRWWKVTKDNKWDSHAVAIQAGGHGIYKPDGDMNELRYDNVMLIPMDDEPFKSKWEFYRKQFAPHVKMPDQWVDMNIENYVLHFRPGFEGVRLETSRGLIWSRPDILIQLAEKAGRI